jgi:hypothetical protein
VRSAARTKYRSSSKKLFAGFQYEVYQMDMLNSRSYSSDNGGILLTDTCTAYAHQCICKLLQWLLWDILTEANIPAQPEGIAYTTL